MLDLCPITPDHPDWQEYLQMSARYILTYWPEASTLSNDRFIDSYEKQLRKKIHDGGRGLFFLQNEGKKIGIANAYIMDKTLYIAEFFIREDYRRCGYGKKLVELLIKWGRKNLATCLIAEVDPRLIEANQFWSSIEEMVSSSARGRNVYTKKIYYREK